MKKTLMFSNIIGNIFESSPETLCFNSYMNEYLKSNIDSTYSMVYIDAPGLGCEENYLPNIIKCFKNINIQFANILEIEKITTKENVQEFLERNKKLVFFLMGGNLITQMEIIDNLDLRETIKQHNDLVIGFCAGAINLSKYSIITSDKDFLEPFSYTAIGRVEIIIEPHYNIEADEKRNNELKHFAKEYDSKIFALPDESIIVDEYGNMIEYGKVYYFE